MGFNEDLSLCPKLFFDTSRCNTNFILSLWNSGIPVTNKTFNKWRILFIIQNHSKNKITKTKNHTKTVQDLTGKNLLKKAENTYNNNCLDSAEPIIFNTSPTNILLKAVFLLTLKFLDSANISTYEYV